MPTFEQYTALRRAVYLPHYTSAWEEFCNVDPGTASLILDKGNVLIDASLTKNTLRILNERGYLTELMKFSPRLWASIIKYTKIPSIIIDALTYLIDIGSPVDTNVDYILHAVTNFKCTLDVVAFLHGLGCGLTDHAWKLVVEQVSSPAMLDIARFFVDNEFTPSILNTPYLGEATSRFMFKAAVFRFIHGELGLPLIRLATLQQFGVRFEREDIEYFTQLYPQLIEGNQRYKLASWYEGGPVILWKIPDE